MPAQSSVAKPLPMHLNAHRLACGIWRKLDTTTMGTACSNIGSNNNGGGKIYNGGSSSGGCGRSSSSSYNNNSYNSSSSR